MNGNSYFERLVASAERIARHAYYPGKEQAVGQCIEDIEDLTLEGRITPEQRVVLREILLGACSHAGSSGGWARGIQRTAQLNSTNNASGIGALAVTEPSG